MLPNQDSTGEKIGKTVVANSLANCLMRSVSFIVLVIIWGIALWVFWKNNWYADLAQNLRIGIIIAIFVLPIIIIAIVDYKLRQYFYRKL